MQNRVRSRQSGTDRRANLAIRAESSMYRARIRPAFDRLYLFLYINRLGFISHTVYHRLAWYILYVVQLYESSNISNIAWFISLTKHKLLFPLKTGVNGVKLREGKGWKFYLLNFHFCFFYHFKIFFLSWDVLFSVSSISFLARQQNFKTWTKLTCNRSRLIYLHKKKQRN